MDELGQRIVRDTARVLEKRKLADELERQVSSLRNEANDIERLMELARTAHR